MELLILMGLGGAVFLLDDLFSPEDREAVNQATDEVDQLDPALLEQLRGDILAEVDASDVQTLTSDFGATYEAGDGATVVDTGELEGTEGPDLIVFDGATQVAFGNGGDDTLVGDDEGYSDNLFGGTGADVLLGEGGQDLIQGEEGNDLLDGGPGDDEVYGQGGADTLYGGEGDDVLSSAWLYGDENPEGLDILSGGPGDDTVDVGDGIALVSLGTGADSLTVGETTASFNITEEERFAQIDDTTIAVITDFDPAEDELVLSVAAPNDDLPSGPLGVALAETTTNLGPATVVVPTLNGQALNQGGAGDAALTAGYAVLQGLTPADLAGAKISVTR